MDTVTSVSALRAACQVWRGRGETIGLVMTMGNLHDGHLALVTKAAEHTDHVVATIFVNPMQFDREEDLAAYPRTLEEDSRQLEQVGAALLFTPNVEEIYPDGISAATQVAVPGFVDRLEGQSRPGHFVGVATVVNKVFNMVQPDVSVFGQKDIQQLLMIQKMVNDLNMPIKVLGLPTMRESDGLAMSSRNNYLTKEQRAKAPIFYAVLSDLADQIKAGDRAFRELESKAGIELDSAGFQTDYVEICRISDFQPADSEDTGLIIVASAWMGKARLIDNLQLPNSINR